MYKIFVINNYAVIFFFFSFLGDLEPALKCGVFLKDVLKPVSMVSFA